MDDQPPKDDKHPRHMYRSSSSIFDHQRLGIFWWFPLIDALPDFHRVFAWKDIPPWVSPTFPSFLVCLGCLSVMATTAGKEKKKQRFFGWKNLSTIFSTGNLVKPIKAHNSRTTPKNTFYPGLRTQPWRDILPSGQIQDAQVLRSCCLGKELGFYLESIFFGGGKPNETRPFLRPKICAPFFGRLNVQLEGEILSGRWFVGLVPRHLGLCWLHVLSTKLQ